MAQKFRLTRRAQHSGFRALAGIGVVVGLTGLAGCKLDNNLRPLGSSPQGLVQFINAAPRYKFVNLNVDSTNAIPLQGYGTGSTIYVNALAAARQLVVRDSANSVALGSSPLLVANQAIYAVIFTQHATGGGVLILQDTVSAPTSNSVGLRLVNASPTAGPVDVYITGSDSTLNTPSASNVTFEAASSYVTAPATGTVRLRVTAAGTKTVLLDVDASSLTAGQVRTIVMIDAVGGGLPATWLAVPDRG
jgi:hypothetical protein